MNEYEFNTKDLVNSFIQVAKKVAFAPSDFFANMPREGGFPPPLSFLAICMGISGVMGSLIFFNPFPLVIAIVGLVFAFVGAGILQFILQNLFNGGGTYEGTFRVVAYAGVIHILSWIPVLGFLLTLYGFYLQIVGLASVHNVTKGKALLAVIIALIVYFLIMIPLGGALFFLR